MANKIVFNYDEIDEVVTFINGLAKQYETASDTFQNAMKAAIASWEGDSKISFDTFITQAVKKYMKTDIPEMVKGIATLLKENAEAMKAADKQISQKMPTSL